MKRSLWFLLGIALLFSFSSCDELVKDEKEDKGKVSFNVSEKQLKSYLSGIGEVSIDDVSQAVISISKGGSVVADFENKSLGLNNWGNGTYTTKSIELAIGSDYALTQFLLKNADGEVIYATPVEDSPLDSMVTDPLPIAFSVSGSSVTPVNVEVVTTQGKDPQQFGYADFTVAVASDYVAQTDTVYVSDVKMEFENMGIALMDKTMGMMSTKSMLVTESFIYYLDMADPFGEEETTEAAEMKAFRVLYNLNEFKQGRRSVNRLLSFTEDEPESLQELYDELKGEYTWNPSLGDWDVTESSKVIFKFPSKINETATHQASNNAVFTIEEYTGTPINIKYIEADDYNGDVPASLKFNMTFDGNKIMDYAMAASYNSDGFPSEITQSFTMDDYAVSTEFTNDQSDLVSKFEYKKGAQSLIKSEITINGDFTEAAIDDKVIEYWAYDETSGEDIEIEVADTSNYYDWWVEVYPENVMNGGSMSITLMNDVKFAGSVDISGLVNASDAIDQKAVDGEWTLEMDKEWIDSVDANIEVYAVYVEDNKKIADLEIYPFETEDTYWSGEWDPVTGEYYEEEVTETYVDPMVILTFGDGSKVDFGTYYDASDWSLVELQQIIQFIMKDL